MTRLEENILKKIKNKKEIKLKSKKKNYNVYSLIGIVWMFLIPIIVAGIICKIFITNETYISLIISCSILIGIYNVVKVISDVYNDNNINNDKNNKKEEKEEKKEEKVVNNFDFSNLDNDKLSK